MGRVRVLLVVAGVIAVTVLISCGAETPIQPTDYSTLTVDSVAFYCAAWHPAPPSQARGLFDVLLASPNGHPPTEADRARIRAVGGEIVYEFHEPIIRAVLDATAIPGFRTVAWGVTNADDYPLEYGIAFPDAITAEDREHVHSLGGSVVRESELTLFSMMIVIIPDASVPALRAWDRPLEVWLEFHGGCPAKPASPWRLEPSRWGIAR